MYVKKFMQKNVCKVFTNVKSFTGCCPCGHPALYTVDKIKLGSTKCVFFYKGSYVDYNRFFNLRIKS